MQALRQLKNDAETAGTASKPVNQIYFIKLAKFKMSLQKEIVKMS